MRSDYIYQDENKASITGHNLIYLTKITINRAPYCHGTSNEKVVLGIDG